MKFHTLIFFAFLFFRANFSLAQNYSTDSSFGNSGSVLIHQRDSYIGYATSVKEGANGKIYFCGFAKDKEHKYVGLGVGCLHADGTVDTLFGNNGYNYFYMDSGSVGAESIALQPDGKIVVCGSYDVFGSVLVRFNTDGNIDSTFGDKGHVINPEILVQPVSDKCLAVQPDGMIVFTGMSIINFILGKKFAVARYAANGTPDISFGDNGITFIQSDNISKGFSKTGHTIIIQPDGKLVMIGSGNTTSNPIGPFQLIAARLNSNGEPDKSFGEKGVYQSSFFSYDEGAFGFLQSDNKIIISSTGFLARLQANGTIDSSFGGSGFFIYPVTKAKSLTRLSGDAIICAGYVNDSAYNTHFTMLRYTADGYLDSSFGDHGLWISYIHPELTQQRTETAVTQSDNKILLAGYAARYLSDSAYSLFMRFNESSVLPIQILFFSCARKDATILLSWKTGSETNIEYFLVQKSSSGMNFSDIAKIYTTRNHNSYSYTDQHSLNGNNYYRLKLVEKDGAYTISNIESCNFESSIKVFPNPAKDAISIQGLNAVTGSLLLLLNSQGNIVNKVFSASENYTWDISKFPSGIYYITVIEAGMQATIRVLKM